MNTDATPPATGTTTGTGSSSTVVNGLLGGIAAVVLSFVPFSTVLGGVIAGYLEGGDPGAGSKAGAIAGLVAFVPTIFGLYVVGLFIGIAPPIFPGIRLGTATVLVMAAVTVFVGMYSVGAGVLGGFLGSNIRDETATP